MQRTDMNDYGLALKASETGEVTPDRGSYHLSVVVLGPQKRDQSTQPSRGMQLQDWQRLRGAALGSGL